MIEVDTQIKMIIANLNDKLQSITHECLQEKAYAGYIDEKLKSIEWDIKVLRNRTDIALKELEAMTDEGIQKFRGFKKRARG